METAGPGLDFYHAGHHSLVTPIDWKLGGRELAAAAGGLSPLAGDTY